MKHIPWRWQELATLALHAALLAATAAVGLLAGFLWEVLS